MLVIKQSFASGHLPFEPNRQALNCGLPIVFVGTSSPLPETGTGAYAFGYKMAMQTGDESQGFLLCAFGFDGTKTCINPFQTRAGTPGVVEGGPWGFVERLIHLGQWDEPLSAVLGGAIIGGGVLCLTPVLMAKEGLANWAARCQKVGGTPHAYWAQMGAVAIGHGIEMCVAALENWGTPLVDKGKHWFMREGDLGAAMGDSRKILTYWPTFANTLDEVRRSFQWEWVDHPLVEPLVKSVDNGNSH